MEVSVHVFSDTMDIFMSIIFNLEWVFIKCKFWLIMTNEYIYMYTCGNIFFAHIGTSANVCWQHIACVLKCLDSSVSKLLLNKHGIRVTN